MRQHPITRLGTWAIVGIILFVVTNWWPSIAGKDESAVIAETRPALSKQAAAAAAEAYIAGLNGGSVQATLVMYESDQLLSGYVQKERLVKPYKAEFEKLVPIDYYRVELGGGGKTGFLVDVDLKSGEVIGWQKRSDGAAPSVREGRRIAESYMRQAGKPLESYEMLLPNKTQPYQFAFEHRSAKLGEAKLRQVVEIRGGEVTAYRTELRAPDSHIAWVERQDRAAASMTSWNLIISAAMGLAAIVLMIVHRKRIAFVRGLWLTFTFLVLYWTNNSNMAPAFKTLSSPGADPFLSVDAAPGMVIVMNVVVTLMGLIGYVSLAAGQPLWRDHGMRPWPRWREPAFGVHTTDSMKRGYMIACLMLGLQSLLFFVAEQRFDMWAVTDPSGSLYNLYRPELFPLMAWTAAISEEAIYRFFGIALFKKLLRSTFLAVLVPSMIWAFSHTQYPIYPVYTRFVEVTALGVLLGYAFLKYGFATVLFAHAVMDSLLMSFSLMNIGTAADIALGLVYIVSPALLAVLLRMLHRRFIARRGVSDFRT
ncbi:CPBP family intramembrane glutamic endopeptidase [Paenibacillus sp. GYB003]|uniref:CPBP family intramembrane glutamic endopeptidase n=1 Tax=Paenibacillus sp. GYB003 TaxID=2994392 RepID=UPI002F96D98A